MCLCIHVYVGAFICVCTCMYRPEFDIRYLLQYSTFIFEAGSFTDSEGLAAQGASAPSCLYFSSSKIIDTCHYITFYMSGSDPNSIPHACKFNTRCYNKTRKWHSV